MHESQTPVPTLHCGVVQFPQVILQLAPHVYWSQSLINTPMCTSHILKLTSLHILYSHNFKLIKSLSDNKGQKITYKFNTHSN